jgi:site-specific DNA-methyltransferase (adenine-specific)/site-specific DNA-methyltransferase (cytosine-N4-specific)
MKTRIRTNAIYNGDCISTLKRFPNDSVDMIFTSPPYAEKRKKLYGGIPHDKYVEWFMPISDQLIRVLKPDASLILNIKENVLDCERQTFVLELILALKKKGWLWIEEYCWYKKNSYPGKWGHRFRDAWERCYHLTKTKDFRMYQDAVKVPIGDWAKERFKSMSEKDFIRNISGTKSAFGRNVSNWLHKKKVYPHNVVVFEKEHYCEPTNVIRFSTECRNRNHPAAFPIELPCWFIKLFTRKGDIVLDPFMGVGTTALASIILARKYIGIEIVKEYIKQAKRNIEELGYVKER